MSQHPHDPTHPFRYTVPPRAFSPVTVRTAPNARCTIRPEGASEAEALVVYADPDGLVRFHARPSVESKEVARLTIESHSAGTVTRHGLELRADFEPHPDMPAPPDDEPTPSGTARPALSADEMVRLTDEHLAERGHSPRPGRDHPQALRAWQRAARVPVTMVKPHTVARPDITHGKSQVQEGPASSLNWSGFELRRSLRFVLPGPGPSLDEPYDWVKGRWRVPAVTGEPQKAYSSMWVGLDGDGTQDLVQAGTESDAVTYSFPWFRLTIASYYAWTEFLPQQQTSVQVTNFAVRPGDDMLVEVWIGNAGGPPSLAGSQGVFLLMNLTTGVSTRVYTPVDGTRVGGSAAVWIVERPTIILHPASGIFGNQYGYSDLANYGSAVMSEAYARKANSARGQGYAGYLGSRMKQITMVDDGNAVLSTVTPLDGESMRFDWKAFA